MKKNILAYLTSLAVLLSVVAICVYVACGGKDVIVGVRLFCIFVLSLILKDITNARIFYRRALKGELLLGCKSAKLLYMARCARRT
jgi:hypothetical protein